MNYVELEIGQVCVHVKKIDTAREILVNIWQDYLKEYKN